MRGVREGVPDTEAEYEKSLFRVVDAREVEATVLRNAEKYARELSIPSFMGPRKLGFGTSALGNFCSDVDTLVLRMAADAARNEGRGLRESGVTNLAARDRVRYLRLNGQLICNLLSFPIRSIASTSREKYLDTYQSRISRPKGRVRVQQGLIWASFISSGIGSTAAETLGVSNAESSPLCDLEFNCYLSPLSALSSLIRLR